MSVQLLVNENLYFNVNYKWVSLIFFPSTREMWMKTLYSLWCILSFVCGWTVTCHKSLCQKDVTKSRKDSPHSKELFERLHILLCHLLTRVFSSNHLSQRPSSAHSTLSPQAACTSPTFHRWWQSTIQLIGCTVQTEHYSIKQSQTY